MRQTVSIVVPRDLVLSANRRTHWGRDASKKPSLRILGRSAARRLYTVPGTMRVRIDVDVFKDRVTHYDPTNLGDTMKSCLDGMVAQGFLDDDDWRHVDGPHMHHGGVDKSLKGRIRLDVTVVGIGGAL